MDFFKQYWFLIFCEHFGEGECSWDSFIIQWFFFLFIFKMLPLIWRWMCHSRREAEERTEEKERGREKHSRDTKNHKNAIVQSDTLSYTIMARANFLTLVTFNSYSITIKVSSADSSLTRIGYLNESVPYIRQSLSQYRCTHVVLTMFSIIPITHSGTFTNITKKRKSSLFTCIFLSNVFIVHWVITSV